MMSANDTIITNILLAHGADINAVDSDGRNLLYYTDNLDRIRFLVSHGANYYITDNFGDTLLLVAVNKGELDLTNYWINKGLSVNIADKVGNTPRDIAINRSEAIANLLKQHGANL